MSCPLFEPTERLPWKRWKGRFRPPLAAPYAGLCHADDEPVAAPDEALVGCCNMGYARGRCERFGGDVADAIRFEIASAGPEAIEVKWLVERGCLPVAQGVSTYERRLARWRSAPELGPLLRRQLDAYVRVWLEEAESS